MRAKRGTLKERDVKPGFLLSGFWDKQFLGMWVVGLTVLVIAVAACSPSAGETEQVFPTESRSGDLVPTESQSGDLVPTAADSLEGQLYTVGFTPDGHAFKGNPEASVTIEEFSSYQCPFCARYFSETYPELTKRYIEQGKVLYIFRDFPLSGQPQSPKAAEAARCAGEVGDGQAFWDMHDRLFAGQREWSGRSDADQVFKGYAAALGLDQTAFDECLDSGRMAEEVTADSREGMARGVRGTPSFFINGQLFVGAQPISAFASAIDRALAGESISPSAAEGDAASPDSDSPSSLEALVPTPAVFDFENGESGDVIFGLGDPDAPVTMVEFSDLQCPVCALHFQQTWPALKERYIDTGRVFYVFKDLPLTDIHPEAFKAHEAARCAFALGGMDAYWQMHDRLFRDQTEWSGNPDHVMLFGGYAADLSLDKEAFSACLDGGEQAEAVQADMEEGFGLGVRGTPTFFIGGYPFSGAYPIQNFDQIITLAENGQLRDAIAEAIARARAEQEQQAQPRPTIAPADVPIGDASIKGDRDAPITIVEYSDYQCPFCARHFEQTLPQLIKNYIEAGKVRYAFKDFPLTSIHPQAAKAAEAARCARELGGDDAYWEMHDRLFASQSEWSGRSDADQLFKAYAGELGIGQTAFDECLDSGRHAAAVQADLQEGAGFGVSGTPAFFINGQPLPGAQPYEVFVQVIEALLAED